MFLVSSSIHLGLCGAPLTGERRLFCSYQGSLGISPPMAFKCPGYRRGALFCLLYGAWKGQQGGGVRKVVCRIAHNFLIGFFSLEIVHHGFFLGPHVLIPALAVAGRQPSPLAGTVDVELVQQLRVRELDVSGAFFVESHIEELAVDVLRLSDGVGGVQNRIKVNVCRGMSIQEIKAPLNVCQVIVGISYPERINAPSPVRENTIGWDNHFRVNFVSLIVGPAVVVVDIVLTLRIPTVLSRQLLKEFQYGILHALEDLGIHLREDDLQVEWGEVVVAEIVDPVLPFLPHVAGKVLGKLVVLEKCLPVFVAGEADVLVYHAVIAHGLC